MAHNRERTFQVLRRSLRHWSEVIWPFKAHPWTLVYFLFGSIKWVRASNQILLNDVVVALFSFGWGKYLGVGVLGGD